jgi:ABC-type multidrug transport system fused ATPase/permease subunit
MASTQFYQQRARHFQEQVGKTETTIRHYSIARLLVALAILALGYFGFTMEWLFYPAALLVILFFFLVKRQLKNEEERKVLLHLVDLNLWEAAAYDYDFKNFPDGERFMDPRHPYSYDLDLFGESSLFQYINRCATKLGESELARDLTDLRFNKASILQRQEAVRELGPLVDFRQQCWATGRQMKNVDFNLGPLWSWLKEPSLFHGKKIISIVKWVFPAITCAALLGIILNPVFLSLFLFLFLVQLTIAAIYNTPITKLQNQLSAYKEILENYSRIFRLLNAQLCTSSIMKGHQQVANVAEENVRKFSSLVNSIESRMNLIARLFGNGLFLYDLHSVTNLEAWREKHAPSLPEWIASLAKWDALLSFAALHFNNPHYAFAEINEQLAISGKEIGHPLIHSRERVNNDFDLGNPAGVMLITGANMAGKSTFLRTIGVNYLLAMNGSPVCAAQWSSPLAALRSGMRTSDSLQEHQSYFYAELHRLQSIVQDLRAGKPMIILLDEILKGTNSTDKQMGSRELIKQLVKQTALVLLATHDIALGDMEEQYPHHIINTCFEGKIENDQLTFDYKLNLGLAQRANATFLMRKMGIIPATAL